MTSGETLADVSVAWPAWSEVLRVLTFRAGYNSAVVLAGATLLGLAAGVIGTFSVLRKRALVSDALAHSALPGIALAFLWGVYWQSDARRVPLLLLGAAISGVLGILCIQIITRTTRLREDTAIGAVLSVFFGVGVVLLSFIQSLGTGQEGGLHHLIYGQTAALRLADAHLTMIVASLIVIIAALCIKEFRLICFDAEFAGAQGWSVSKIDLLMMGSIVLVTVVGLQTVGMLLIVALLIIPAATARFWTDRLNRMTILAALFGAASGYFGAAASSLLPRLPAGAVIVLVSGALFSLSFLFAPNRGLVASWLRRVGLTLRIADDHFLRDAYELLERGEKLEEPHLLIAIEDLQVVHTWSPLERWFYLGRIHRKGLIRKGQGGRAFSLTEKGFATAQRLIRNHRLWEEYVLSQGHVATSHVDYSADLVEHVLSRELVNELEQALSKRGTLPMLPSVHPL